MATKTKILKRRKSQKNPAFLSQKEIIKKINESTRNSYKYLEILSAK